MSGTRALMAATVVTALLPAALARAQPASMTFFVTSVGSGKGDDLGGLAGADAHCQQLAEAVGGQGAWHAYLSTQASSGQSSVNARDRIGNGPWRDAQGVVIAANVAQ